jgi:hypothetical protein
MPTYTVTVRELHYKAIQIDALDAEDARARAEDEDWRKWPYSDLYEGESEIFDVHMDELP